jgi:hypothetical protein
MGTQTHPLYYSGEIGVAQRNRPSQGYSRQQQSWEQPRTTVTPKRLRKQLSSDAGDPKSSGEVMEQPEITAATPTIKDSSAVLAEIDGLAAGVEDEVKPSDYAYTRARSLVESAYGQVKLAGNVPEIVPQVSVTTDDVGGIRLAWRLGPKQIRANFGAAANLRSYLYFESVLEHYVKDLDVKHLAGGLDWLIKK